MKDFLVRHKILTGIIIVALLCGLMVPNDDAKDTADPPTSAITESISAPEESANETQETASAESPSQPSTIDLSNIPAYNGAAYVAVNDNVPYFSDSDMTTTAYENYSSLDNLGRCGVVMACVGKETMPTEERGSIGMIKPTGWHTIKYDNVDGKYLYNRCHLIGYQLTAENANEKNLITGTRYLNIEGMLPFENMVADYIKETGNHVMYRVTPVFEGNNLLTSGVLMEGKSVEDNGAGISYCVYAYNVQPGIGIDYGTGDSWSESGSTAVTASTNPQTTQSSQAQSGDYVLNENTKKFHVPTCRSVAQMNNPIDYSGSRDDLIAQGYEPCKNCNP